MQQLGAPLPMFDDTTCDAYVLVPVDLVSDPLGGFSACIPGIAAFGGGDSPQEATLALASILGKILACPPTSSHVASLPSAD